MREKSGKKEEDTMLSDYILNVDAMCGARSKSQE